MSVTYSIERRVWGTHGGRPYEFAAGKVTTKDSAEKRLLDHLVSIGRAEIVAPVARNKKKEA